MKNILLLLCLALAVTACTTTSPQRPANDSNYTTDFRYPQQTAHYVLQEKIIYPDPAYGVMLRYIDKRMYGDLISIYVYPVPSIVWENSNETLTFEMESVLAEIDQALTIGLYNSRSEVALSDFSFTAGGKNYTGKKARMQLSQSSGKVLDSDVYLFLAEDKIIKFRTSFDAGFTQDWTGDAIVKEILPEITPPPESAYMRELREQHMEEIADELLRVLREEPEE